jgi:hypothetical protein
LPRGANAPRPTVFLDGHVKIMMMYRRHLWMTLDIDPFPDT